MSNSKGQLQELLQRKVLPLPTYHTTSTGPPHFPIVTCTVTVHYDGKKLIEEVVQRGGKKKDLEKTAAAKMLQRIQQENRTVAAHHRGGHLLQSPSVSPAAHVSLAVATRSASLSPHRSPSPSATPTASPVSVLQEKLQGMSFSPPKYEEQGSPTTAFRVRCVVYNGLQQPVLESHGEGRSKRSAKDAAARDMLQKMNVSELSPVVPTTATPAMPEVLDPGLRDDIAVNLSPYSPHFHFWQGPGEVLYTCSCARHRRDVIMTCCSIYCRCIVWRGWSGRARTLLLLMGGAVMRLQLR